MSSPPPTFQNPIIRGFNPDPTICAVPPSTLGGQTVFYLSTSTFVYFPGCPIYRSTDLINWTLIGHALTRPSQLNLRTSEPGAGSWASTLRYRKEDKKWYLFNAIWHRYRPQTDERIWPRGFFIWTDDIANEHRWSDPIYLDQPGFDPDVFWDQRGRAYLSTTIRKPEEDISSHGIVPRVPPPDARPRLKNFAIYFSLVDLTTGNSLGPMMFMRDSKTGVAEGSHVFKKGEYYYLFVAEGGTEQGHQEWVYRTKEDDAGAWGFFREEGRQLLCQGELDEVQSCGHADLVEDGQGQWWAVFLAVRTVRKEKDKELSSPAGEKPVEEEPLESSRRADRLEPQLGRETFLVKVDWIDDWPVFNNGNRVSLVTEGRNTIIPQQLSLPDAEHIRWRANLDSAQTTLELGWYQKNTPLKPCYSFADRPGYLRLHGSCYNLSSPEAPCLLLRKQESFHDEFSVDLDFDPHWQHHEAGLVVYWSQYAYASIGLVCDMMDDCQVKLIVLRAPTFDGENKMYPLLAGGEVAEKAGRWNSKKPVTISARAFPTRYTLTINQETELASFSIGVEDLATAPPMGASFTGMMFGIYSFGKWQPVPEPADFCNIYIKQSRP